MRKAWRRSGNEESQAARFSVKETDRQRRGRVIDVDPAAGARCINAAFPMRSTLLCLEHELQTVVNGGRRRRDCAFKCSR
jgi:hypothetical protein